MSLKEEILARADCAATVGERDLDAIASIVSAGRTKRALVSIDDIQAALMSTGEWWGIKAAAAQGNVPSSIVIDMAGARFAHVDFSLPLVGAQWDALVTAQIIAASTRERLQAMSFVPAPVDRLEVEAALFNPDGTRK